jgi:glycosyltransferase involved in cell wall biosynthesis
MSELLVSVIMPVYNGERYLGEAIESVLAQTYGPIELIVIDDGSLDSSSRIAKGFPSVRYAVQANLGVGAALNHGIHLAQGDFLAFLDADDLWAENKTARQMSAFQEDPELDMVFGHVEQFLSPEVNGHYAMTGIYRGYLKGAMLIKKNSFSRAGQYETKVVIGDFIAWYARAIDSGLKSLMLSDIVLKRRIHKHNMGTLQREHQADYVRVLKETLDRRRILKKP